MIEDNPLVYFFAIWAVLLVLGPAIRVEALLHGRAIFKSALSHAEIFNELLRRVRLARFILVTLIALLGAVAAMFTTDDFLLLGLMIWQVIAVGALECGILYKVEVDTRDAAAR